MGVTKREDGIVHKLNRSTKDKVVYVFAQANLTMQFWGGFNKFRFKI